VILIKTRLSLAPLYYLGRMRLKKCHYGICTLWRHHLHILNAYVWDTIPLEICTYWRQHLHILNAYVWDTIPLELCTHSRLHFCTYQTHMFETPWL
jgi:hypothetical protein